MPTLNFCADDFFLWIAKLKNLTRCSRNWTVNFDYQTKRLDAELWLELGIIVPVTLKTTWWRVINFQHNSVHKIFINLQIIFK